MAGYMYILRCANGAYYTGSTVNLERRLREHQNGEGSHFTKKHLPCTLVYFEEYGRIEDAFFREKQIQGWSRKKKEALINGKPELLPELAHPSTGSGQRPLTGPEQCPSTVRQAHRPEYLNPNSPEDLNPNGPVGEPVEPMGLEQCPSTVRQATVRKI